MDREKPDYQDVFPQVLQSASWEKRATTMFAGAQDQLPVFGQYVRTGPGPAPLVNQIGYVVQIRRRQGIFGSDIYLLRHCNGELVQHSNNMYLPLTQEEIEAVLPCFGSVKPSAEGENPVYGIGGPSTRTAGFLIEPPEGFQLRGGEGARMRMTTIGADGSKSLTDTVFL
ncbi:hypothetical protein [Pseudomonas fluorescens]|uniref:hypothetical protein n=1 Tax=Pseudomonas fluorescens TaxID=294 RepID=UPI0010EB367A|nr:hypothetical protein [Pseudomonas fluorescens]TCV62758.1 hypothetical protein EDB98_11266 [Pseudomonas fluorescens]